MRAKRALKNSLAGEPSVASDEATSVGRASTIPGTPTLIIAALTSTSSAEIESPYVLAVSRLDSAYS